MIKVRYIVAALLCLAATALFATVTFNIGTGTGFVGKGDVQNPFGWNDQKLTQYVSTVTFSLDGTDTYAAVCTFTTGEGTRGEQTHNISIPRSTSVNATVAYDIRARGAKPITGFNLTGYGDITEGGTVPVVGEACVANPDGVAHNGTWSSVDLVSSTNALFVHTTAPALVSSAQIWP